MPKSLFIRFLMILSGMAMLLLPHLATAETWYVKKSSTKLQAEASARSNVLSRLKQGRGEFHIYEHPSLNGRAL